MKSTIKVATGKDLNCGSYSLSFKCKGGMPGLFWAELVKLLSEYDKFERGKKGTRFDRWL